MNIHKLKVNGFGKVENEEIFLKNGINIIKGNNEAGKSTIAKFIPSVFYGLSKNKNGKEISDFDKYYPWEKRDFSGKIEYELDNGEEYEVFRDFNKKNPIIYNSLKEDISKNYKIDKNKGIVFFEEQCGIDEQTFLTTAVIEQEEVKLEKGRQSEIVQKISNKIDSGDDNISYKKTIEKLGKRQNEEVGTDRTTQRPINIVNSKITELSKERDSLDVYKSKNSENIFEQEESKYEVLVEEKKKEFLKELKEIFDSNSVKSAEIEFSKNVELDYIRRIDNLEKSLNDINENKSSKSVIVYLICFITFVALFCVLMAFRPHIYNYIIIAPIIISLILFLFSLYKNKKEKTTDINKVQNEIDVLNRSLEDQKNETKKKEETLLSEIERNKAYLFEKYNDDIEHEFLEDNMSNSREEIQKQIEYVDKNIGLLKIKISTLEIESEKINDNLDELVVVEEELENLINEKEELEKLNNIFNLTKKCMEKAYSQVKQNISPRFTQNLKYIVSKISNNNYKDVHLNDDGIEVEIKNGKYIPVSRLSVGTIDQIYLSLRLSALNEVSEETVPIIFDETFAYFDDERLCNILQFIKDNLSNQILIFTCSNREMECLKKLQIDYHLINLEK